MRFSVNHFIEIRSYNLKPGRRDEFHRLVVEQSRSEEHTSELQSQSNLVCRLLLEKKKKIPPRSMSKTKISLTNIPRLNDLNRPTLESLTRPAAAHDNRIYCIPSLYLLSHILLYQL